MIENRIDHSTTPIAILLKALGQETEHILVIATEMKWPELMMLMY